MLLGLLKDTDIWEQISNFLLLERYFPFWLQILDKLFWEIEVDKLVMIKWWLIF